MKARRKSKGYLHLGSSIPMKDIEASKEGKGQHTALDSAFLHREPTISSLGKKFRHFEFVPKRAHKFLDSAIKKQERYHTIRLDMPHVGIIDKKARFDLLCQKMKDVLTKNGNIIILTDFTPNRKGHARQGGKRFATVNLVDELQKADFKVRFFETDDPRIISRSSTALAEKNILDMLSKKHPFFGMVNQRTKRYLVIATKRGN